MRTSRFKLVLLVALCVSSGAPVLSLADSTNVNPTAFDFSFKPAPTGERYSFTHVFCNVAGEVNHNCNSPNPASGIPQGQAFNPGNLSNDFDTPFVQEIVTIDGIEYFHVVVGRASDGFAQEIYLKRSNIAGFSGEGQEGPFSDSGGATCLRYAFNERLANIIACLNANNGADPLGTNDPARHDAVFTGNGMGNPSALVMRQIVTDPAGGFSQEFLKNSLDKKPTITQDVALADINSHFVMDMSNSDYNTNSIAGTMINTLNLTFPDLADGLGDFTFVPGAGTNITGGRYTFKRTTVNYTTPLGGGLTLPKSEYTYYDGSIDPVLDVNWSAFRDPAQNPHPLN
ncbi:MAG: hypothetical protein FD130_509 [Halothiobacillaceae bacterium]|nr:MAG: hypothetical protein FD130_509 [Halothiobacillaceae bacterium]